MDDSQRETNGVQEEREREKKKGIRKCKDSKTSFMGRSDEKRSECSPSPSLYISPGMASYLDAEAPMGKVHIIISHKTLYDDKTP